LTSNSLSVLHEEFPDVSRSARTTIHGHIKVAVPSTVDSAGDVVNETPENLRDFDDELSVFIRIAAGKLEITTRYSSCSCPRGIVNPKTRVASPLFTHQQVVQQLYYVTRCNAGNRAAVTRQPAIAVVELRQLQTLFPCD
jgi:hypothetical protein